MVRKVLGLQPHNDCRLKLYFYLLQINQEKEKGVRERRKRKQKERGMCGNPAWLLSHADKRHVLTMKTEENVTRMLCADGQPSQECKQAGEGNRTDPY